MDTVEKWGFEGRWPGRALFVLYVVKPHRIYHNSYNHCLRVLFTYTYFSAAVQSVRDRRHVYWQLGYVTVLPGVPQFIYNSKPSHRIVDHFHFWANASDCPPRAHVPSHQISSIIVLSGPERKAIYILELSVFLVAPAFCISRACVPVLLKIAAP
jgi:hypothetical protein